MIFHSIKNKFLQSGPSSEGPPSKGTLHIYGIVKTYEKGFEIDDCWEIHI